MIIQQKTQQPGLQNQKGQLNYSYGRSRTVKKTKINLESIQQQYN